MHASRRDSPRLGPFVSTCEAETAAHSSRKPSTVRLTNMSREYYPSCDASDASADHMVDASPRKRALSRVDDDDARPGSTRNSVVSALTSPLQQALNSAYGDASQARSMEDTEVGLQSCLISARVTASRVVGKSFVEYYVEVSITQSEMNATLSSWSIWRRYSEFEALDKQLRATLPKDVHSTLPSLPKAGLFRSFDAEYIDNKTTQLNSYIATLLGDSNRMTPASRTAALCGFLAGSLHKLAGHYFFAFQDAMLNQIRMADQREQLVIERDGLKSSLQQSEAQRHNALAQLQQYRRLVEEAEAKVAKQPTLTATPVSHDFCAEQVEMQSTQSQTDTDTAELDLLRAQLAERDADIKELARQRDEAFQLAKRYQAEKKLLVRELRSQREAEAASATGESKLTPSADSTASKSPVSEPCTPNSEMPSEPKLSSEALLDASQLVPHVSAEESTIAIKRRTKHDDEDFQVGS